MARSRAWCLTINNYTEEEYNDIQAHGEYGILGREVGQEGTPHLQGYIYFKDAKRLSTLKKINQRAHWEQSKGGHKSNQKYCSKENNFVEWGLLPDQGKRTDLDITRELVREPEPLRKVCDLMNFQCIKVAEKWLTYNEPKRTWKPEVRWYHGPSGSGKTKKANEDMPNAYTKTGPNKWWDGYDGHEDVILDDLRSSHIEFTELLMILDRYEKRVEHKGGMRQLRAKRIIITSIYSPDEMYRNMQARATTHEPIEQLLRRIDLTQKFDTEVQGNTKPGLTCELNNESDDDWTNW